MAKKVTITFKNPVNEANIDHLEVWWKLTAGGTYVQLGSDIPFVTGVANYSVEDTSVNVADDAVLYYQARAYNNNGGEIQGVDYSLVEGNITISGGGTHILDIYPNAVGAYSLRQLKTGVTSVVEIRRDNDDTFADFTADEISDGTLVTWVGANNGFVSKWYDQSGNNKDAIQASTQLQPQIVSAGVVLLSNSKPTVDFLSYKTMLSSTGLLTANTWSINMVATVTDLLTSQQLINQHSGTGDTGRMYLSGINSSDLKNRMYFESMPINSPNDWVTGQQLHSIYANNNDYFLKENNGAYNEVLSDTPFTPAVDEFNIGAFRALTTNYFSGYIQEVIVWDTDKTSDREAIENNINTEYSIY